MPVFLKRRRRRWRWSENAKVKNFLERKKWYSAGGRWISSRSVRCSLLFSISPFPLSLWLPLFIPFPLNQTWYSRSYPRGSSRTSYFSRDRFLLFFFFPSARDWVRLTFRPASHGGRWRERSSAVLLLRRINLRHFRPLLPLGHLELAVSSESSVHT